MGWNLAGKWLESGLPFFKVFFTSGPPAETIEAGGRDEKDRRAGGTAVRLFEASEGQPFT